MFFQVEAYCILLTDMLLIAKTSKLQEQDPLALTYVDFGVGSTNSALRLLKPPIRLDKLDFREMRDAQSALLIVFTDFPPSIASSYILSCDNIATWMAKVRLAQVSLRTSDLE